MYETLISDTISKTDLARRTRQVVDQARRGRTIIVESYGEEQVAILDILDYRLLRAVAVYHAVSPQERAQTPAPIRDETLAPRGLTEEQVQQAIAEAGGDVQTGWNRIIAAYLDGDISLGRASQLLGLIRFEFQDRLNRLGLPLQLGPASVEEARAEGG